MLTADKIPINVPHNVIDISPCYIKSRLIEMGISTGITIVKLFVAPGGDPIAFSINGDYVLSLRISEADNIIVEEKL